MTPEQHELRDALEAMPGRLADVARGIPDPAAPPAPGEWSACDITLHLAAVEVGVWHVRLEALATESFPEWPWVEPDRWPLPEGEPFDRALAIFAAHRAATIARLDALGESGWNRRGRHATYGILDVAGLLRIALDHDQEHVAQIERALGAGFEPTGREPPPSG